ncbi:MAG TPA: dihydrolipoamide acetyltransferase family protein [bacterium]|nr:dihydrolipoamide acetyltransferase family protein [bacterium]
MATEVILPKLGLTQEEGTIVRWLKSEGSRVAKGEPLFEVMTDKATLEVEAPASGVLLRILVTEGETVPVAVPIAVIGEPGEGVHVAARSSVGPGPDPVSSHAARAAGVESVGTDVRLPGERVRVSPRARALAAARGVDVRSIIGTGPGGRIVERDVQQALGARIAPVPPTPAATRPGPEAPAAPVATRMRAIIARRMMESLHTTAQLTLTTEADMAEAVRLREEIAPELERRDGVSVTYTDLIVRAAALALREHLALNARWEGEEARRLGEIHIGVAVALDEGLVVPVIRHADRATVSQISAAIRDLSERARALRLRPDEMQGSTFTVTNLGMFEIDAFTPILNPPEAAILGAGRVHRRPAAVGDRVEIRPAMALSLTFDHRLVDGAPAAQFLQRVKHLLEHPYLLLLP